MNLQEFIDYRKQCSMCDNNLITRFPSDRKQTTKYEANRLTFTFPLDALNRNQKDYIVSYSFGLSDNSFQIEFYNEEEDHYYKEAPKFLLDRFLTLHNNLRKANFKFSRECANFNCIKYVYFSKFFDMDLRCALYEPLLVRSEYIYLSCVLSEKNEYRNYRMDNDLLNKKTNLFFWQSSDENNNRYNAVPSGATILQLPLIPFVSKEETLQRLNNLIVFT